LKPDGPSGQVFLLNSEDFIIANSAQQSLGKKALHILMCAFLAVSGRLNAHALVM
jgi:hypothetical protein